MTVDPLVPVNQAFRNGRAWGSGALRTIDGQGAQPPLWPAAREKPPLQVGCMAAPTSNCKMLK
jgi:hypothetical protein